MYKLHLSEAYSFHSLLSIDEIRARLNETGIWVWSIRDSDFYGVYLLARPDKGYTKLRLLGDPGDYLLAIAFDPYDLDGKLVDGHVPDEVMYRVVHSHLLPAINAKNVRDARGL